MLLGRFFCFRKPLVGWLIYGSGFFYELTSEGESELYSYFLWHFPFLEKLLGDLLYVCLVNYRYTFYSDYIVHIHMKL